MTPVDILRFVSSGRAMRCMRQGSLIGLLMVLPGVARAEDSPSPASAQAVNEVAVQRVGRECFSTLVHGSGYLMPRASATVMFNAPNFRIIDITMKTGDMIKRGDVVAKAVPVIAPNPVPAGGADVLIKSLASGLILDSAAYDGMLSSPKAAPLFTIAVDGEIEAVVDVPNVHILELQTGQPARLTTRSGLDIMGHVRVLPVTVDRLSQMGKTRIAIETDQTLAAGSFVRATIEASRSCHLGVPLSALRRTSGGTELQVVEDNLIITRKVTVGKSNASDAEIIAGLTEGDFVVASIGTSLRSGDKVNPVLSDPRDLR